MMENEISAELERLFEFSKNTDEFEFVCVLIGFNGMGDQRALTHLYESRSYVNDMVARYKVEQHIHSKTRIGLHIYCHIFEMDELYNMLGNLLRISSNQGFRYLADLYNRNDSILTPTDKLDQIRDISMHSHFEKLVDLIKEIYKNNLRNSFFHSAYSLLGEDYHIIKGKAVKINNQEYQTLNIVEYVFPLIDQAIDFIHFFFNLIDKYKLSYRSNILVEARMPNKQMVIILGDPKTGLVGFQTLDGSWIKLNTKNGDNYIEAMNINLSGLSLGNELRKELEDYVDKLKPVGKLFNSIRDKVIESNDPDLLRLLGVVYYNSANNMVHSATGKPNQQKEAIYRSALKNYDLSITANASFDRVYLNKGNTIIKLHQGSSTLTNKIRFEVLAMYNSAIERNPNSFEAWSNSAQIIQEIGNEEVNSEKQLAYFNEGIERFKKSIELHPHDASVYSNLAWLKRRLAYLDSDKIENFKEQIKYSEIALEKKPGRESILALATALDDLAQFEVKEEAIKLINRAIEILTGSIDDYGGNAETYYRLGNKYFSIGKLNGNISEFQNSAESFEKAIVLDAMHINALNNLSHCQLVLAVNENDALRKSELLKTAKQRILQVLSYDVDQVNAWRNLGYVDIELAKSLQGDERIEMINGAIENFNKVELSDINSCSFDLARAYSLLENKDQSLLYLKKWISEGNIWGSAGFIDDFDNVKDQENFKKLTE